MSEVDVKNEGQLLGEDYELSTSPAPVRTVETVTLEIRTLQRQAQQVVLGYAIEIGRRLEEVKAMLPHGQWGNYLKNEVNYSQSTAQNFMKIFREYGASQQSLFGGEAKSQAFGNLTYSKALQLLALPDAEEREQFMAEHDVESMSTRELSEALKARDAAQEEAAAAREDAQNIRQEAAEANRKAREAQEALEKANAKTQNLQDALSEANTSAQAAEKEHARLLRELEELRSRPVEVAVEVDTKAVEAAREAAVAEMTEKVEKAESDMKAADTARKTAEDALAAAQKELAELKAQEPQVRELTPDELQAVTADAVEKARAGDLERVKALEKQLASADGDVAAFRVHYEAWQDHYNKLSGYLAKIADREPERAEKLRMAVKAAVERMTAG